MSVYVSPTSMMTAVAPHWEKTGLRVASHLPPSALGLPAQARRSMSPGPPRSLCGLPPRARTNPHHSPRCWVAPAPLPAGLGPTTYTDKEGRDRGAASDMDHGQQAGQVPLSGPREAQSGTEMGGGHEPGRGPPTDQIVDHSSRPDVPLELSSLTPAPGPGSPMAQFFPVSPRLPFAFWTSELGSDSCYWGIHCPSFRWDPPGRI